jgi:plasmid stabilization system protein ParE
MKVSWSASAIQDFNTVIRFIAERNPTAAERIASVIDRAARELGRLRTGRPGRVSGTHERILPGLPYILVYSVREKEEVLILRVIHGARDWRPGEWPRSSTEDNS